MDVTTAILDPELGCSAFTVERLLFTRRATGTTSRSQTFQAMGCVHPGTPEMIQLLPEEERHETFIAVYTDFALSLGSDHGSTYTGPDRIHWGGETWRVVRVRDWQSFGYYQALAVALADEPLRTAGGGNIVRGEINRNEQAPQCGAATIEVAEMLHE